MTPKEYTLRHYEKQLGIARRRRRTLEGLGVFTILLIIAVVGSWVLG